MAKVRVYELAKELGVESKVVLTKLNLAKATVAEGKPQQAAATLRALPAEADADGPGGTRRAAST